MPVGSDTQTPESMAAPEWSLACLHKVSPPMVALTAQRATSWLGYHLVLRWTAGATSHGADQAIWSRTAANAVAAVWRSSRLCAADTCILIRALPTGTTG